MPGAAYARPGQSCAEAAVEKLAKQDGTSVNQFVVVAVAEKLSAMATTEEFAQRRARADMDAFDRFTIPRVCKSIGGLGLHGNLDACHLGHHRILPDLPAMIAALIRLCNSREWHCGLH